MDQQTYKQRMFTHFISATWWSVLGAVAILSGVGLFSAGVTGFAAVLGYSAAGIGLAIATYQEMRAWIELHAATQDRQAERTAEHLTQLMAKAPAQYMGRADGKSWADAALESQQTQEMRR